MYKLSRLILLIGLILSIQLIGRAQSASIIFQSNNNESIRVTINHIKQHENFNESIKINQLSGDRPYNVKIDFENDTVVIKKNIYVIDNGLAHIYEVTKNAISLKKVVPAASYKTPKNQLELVLIDNINFVPDTVVKDSVVKDTTYVIPFATYYKLENYEGRIGCAFPIKDVEQASLRGTILGENLEESKLEKVVLAVQEMDSACLLVDQVKELIVLFEYEETRLEFAKFIFDFTFDIDNYEKLYNVFNFENSKDELKNLVGKK